VRAEAWQRHVVCGGSHDVMLAPEHGGAAGTSPRIVQCSSANGDNGMVACDVDTSVLQRGVEDDDVALSECRETCDASFEGDGDCHSITYSTSERRCKLNAAAGKPRRFCNRPGWETHWRVDVAEDQLLLLPQSAGDGLTGIDLTEGHHLKDTSRRLQTEGAQLIDTATGESVALHGVNMFIDYLEFDDIALIRSLLPTANLVRLVGVLWGDAAPKADGSVCAPTDRCCVDDAASGYFAESCLASLLVAVERLGAAGLWVIVAAKGRYAAGDGWPATPDVFHSEVLTARVCALWRRVAGALRHLPMIAGFEA